MWYICISRNFQDFVTTFDNYFEINSEVICKVTVKVIIKASNILETIHTDKLLILNECHMIFNRRKELANTLIN